MSRAKYEPLPNQPPAGSVWAAIEEARRRLDWSARELSRKAGLVPAHYTGIAHRNTWNADLATRDKFVRALVAAGIPENDLGEARPPSPRDREAVVLPGDPMRQRAAEVLVQRGYRIVPSVLAVSDIHDDPNLNAELMANLAEDGIKSKIRYGLLPAEAARDAVGAPAKRPSKTTQKTG